MLLYNQYEYTQENIDKLSIDIRSNLVDNLISDEFRDDFAPDYHRWKRKYFGLCVPATFVFLYFMNTNRLTAMKGKLEVDGLVYPFEETHYWVKDKDTGAIIDLTKEQYTDNELELLYATGKTAKYYGHKENPTARFFRLMKMVQPSITDYITTDINNTSNLTQFMS